MRRTPSTVALALQRINRTQTVERGMHSIFYAGQSKPATELLLLAATSTACTSENKLNRIYVLFAQGKKTRTRAQGEANGSARKCNTRHIMYEY